MADSAISGDRAAVLRAAVSALSATRARFALVGALAFGYYTTPRTTLDLDLLVEDDRDAEDALRARFLVIEETRDVYFDQRALVLEVPTRVTPVEVFFATHWLPRLALERRRMVDLTPIGVRCPVATPEDLLLLKAAVAAHPDRPRPKFATDLSDLGRMVSADPDLDLAYLREGASRLGGAASRVLADAGLRLD